MENKCNQKYAAGADQIQLTPTLFLFSASGGPKDSFIQMSQKCRFTEDGRDMTKCGVKRTSPIIIVIPCHRVQLSHTFPFFLAPLHLWIVGRFIDCQDIVKSLNFFRPKLIPFIRPPFSTRKTLQAGKFFIKNFQAGGLNSRMNMKHSSHEFGVPLPIIFRIRRTVNADKSLSGLDKTLHYFLCSSIKNISGGV